MLLSSSLIPDYFVSPFPALWSVTDDGEAVAWVDQERTALMLKHLQLVLTPLNKELNGLPSLTAILFIVDALRQGWTREAAKMRIDQVLQAGQLAQQPSGMIDEISIWLSELSSMPDEFRHGPGAHAAVLCELLEELPRAQIVVQQGTAEQTIQWIAHATGEPNAIGLHRISKSATYQLASRTIATLDFAASRLLDAEALRLRLKTGLDQLPDGSSESFALPDPHPFATLLRQLQQSSDRDLAEAARMALMSSGMLTLPRTPTQVDDLPMGGVSDVTNKGQPERLLMTELAVEPDLLIARIANQQALYLRREYPPTPQTRPRRMLIEAGIRTWGTPRLFLSTLAMALCASEERRGADAISVATIGGEQYWTEDFTTRDGLVRHFERLSADRHPGAALAKLLQEADEAEKEFSETVLIVTAATARDPEFQHSLMQLPMPYILAKVEPDGTIQLQQVTRSGILSLQQCQLKVQPAQLVNSPAKEPTDLPQFLRLQECPLRFSTALPGRHLQVFGMAPQQCAWLVSQDRQVLCFRDKHSGAIHVGDLPWGNILASQVLERDVWCLVIAQYRPGSRIPDHFLVRAEAGNGLKVIPLDTQDEDSRYVSYTFDHSDLIRHGRQLAYIDTHTGAVLARLKNYLPYLGGVFLGHNELFVADRNQSKIQLIPLADTTDRYGLAVRSGQGYPVAFAFDLSWMQKIHDRDAKPQSTGIRIESYASAPRLERVDPSGTRALLRLFNVHTASHDCLLCRGKFSVLLEVSLVDPRIDMRRTSTYATPEAFELTSYRGQMPGPNFKKRYTHIGVARGRIILRSQKYDAVMSFVHTPEATLQIERLNYRVDFPMIQFGRSKPVRLNGQCSKWTLRHARLPASDAWLDSRGLLHLRSGNDGTELSVVLANECAAWHSSGVVFGNSYFTGAKTEAPKHVIDDWFEEFTFTQCST